MSHTTHRNESCHTYEWVISYIWGSHGTHMNESCHTNEWVMSHIWVGWSHATYKWITGWCGVATVSRINKTIGLLCRILSLLYGSFAKETYNLIDPTNQSHLIERRVYTLFCKKLSHTCEWVLSRIQLSHVIDMNASCHTYECSTGWSRRANATQCNSRATL